jgi:cell division protein FtsW (lipid II flippase)
VTSPRVEPLDPPMVPFALGGMAAFAVAAVIVLLAGGPSRWLWICVAGFLLGIPGLLTMLRHDANRRRRRALSHPSFQVHDA